MSKKKTQPFEKGLLEHNKERLEAAHIRQFGKDIHIKVTDLREILFNFKGDAEIRVSTHLLYVILIHRGIRIKGFTPNKTALRHTYKLSIEEVNKILPGSFPSTEKESA